MQPWPAGQEVGRPPDAPLNDKETRLKSASFSFSSSSLLHLVGLIHLLEHLSLRRTKNNIHAPPHAVRVTRDILGRGYAFHSGGKRLGLYWLMYSCQAALRDCPTITTLEWEMGAKPFFSLLPMRTSSAGAHWSLMGRMLPEHPLLCSRICGCTNPLIFWVAFEV